MTRRDLIGSAAVAAVLPAGAAWASAEAPGVSGPIHCGRHGRPFSAYLGPLGALGYVEEEYFLEGQATRYRPRGELTADGRWSVEPAGLSPYKTRLLVRRPVDPAKFNGTLVLEWINVTAGFENATMGGVSSGVYDSGFAFATVSCQRIGVDGFARNPQGLRQWDPERYAALSIPGDSLAYDIFSQAGRALGPARRREGPDPLHGLDVRKVIATSASQSAIRLRSYINALQPRERVFDGFVSTLDFGTAAGFDDEVYDPTILPRGDTGPLFRTYTRIRDDLTTPVVVVNSEFETLRFLPSRQPDSDRFRFWEIAGASHVPAPDGRRQLALYARDGLTADRDHASGSEVMWQPTADAALDHMHRWINGGPPPAGPAAHTGRDRRQARDRPRRLRQRSRRGAPARTGGASRPLQRGRGRRGAPTGSKGLRPRSPRPARLRPWSPM